MFNQSRIVILDTLLMANPREYDGTPGPAALAKLTPTPRRGWRSTSSSPATATEELPAHAHGLPIGPELR
ncbi:hypothetical protein LVX13_38540 [Streptomyces albulus]|uniref:hypothetical protein n=1 Tax=Streptomyces noursei TaxID=1971 RepID=UPI001F402221|nr:hypothetical protein [Streptomyces noursei]MCE4948946.1 hypothetical protein [Streptomyces noursei]